MPAIQQPAPPLPLGKRSPRRRIGLALLSLGLLTTGCSEGDPPTSAPNDAAAAPAETRAAAPTAYVGTSVGSQIAEQRSRLVVEAVSALQESYVALDLLATGNADDAVRALARATGKLDVVLAADPDLALAPVEVRVRTHDVVATPAAVKALRNLAETALDEGRLQDARHLIASLASEHVISTVNIPLGSYPAAIKRAAARTLAGNTAEARAILETALATLVVEDRIIALPLARAEALLLLAQPLAEKTQRSADENGRLAQLLAGARLQIELAKALGYATKKDLAALSEELEAIAERTQGDGSGQRLFDRIKSLFAEANRQANARPKS